MLARSPLWCLLYLAIQWLSTNTGRSQGLKAVWVGMVSRWTCSLVIARQARMISNFALQLVGESRKSMTALLG